MGIVAESEDSKKDRCEWNGMGLAGTRGAPGPGDRDEGRRSRRRRTNGILTVVAFSGSLLAQLLAILRQS